MAKDNKFGTFGGVYTPSILTILGVIMYLRLPWVIGHAGLYAGLGIIVVAHVVSFSTGLSISSIATDKNVGAGGPYYIVSRSLGLPIGGTLGLALFVGLAFSVSLYVIGFSESLLRTLEIDATPNNIRVCGSVTLLVLTVITLISTALAIKTQYLIFLLILLSLGSIFMGTPPSGPAVLEPAEGGESLAKLFAIFFPAVTGFTAGVNMSGDLRDPKRAIPRGTLLAISSGLVVYVGLAVFLALRLPRAQLLENPSVLGDFAASSALLTAGIWGATLSSALGSIMGAPRILQAVSRDRITPVWLAKGYGPTLEPRNALVIAFVIAWGGILIAELDAIARIVSMVFLTTYGFLNLSCAIESWASPDFRPAFKIPRSVSVVGALTCVVVMIQLDLPAMLLAVAMMAGLYVWLTRRQIRLESGDTWEGFWASLVRTGLHRLARQSRQQRNWRPNVLLFRRAQENDSLTSFAHSLVSGNGLLSDFLLRSSTRKPSDPTDAVRSQALPVKEPSKLGVFHHEISTDAPLPSIVAAARYHGFGGLAPNTVLLDWPDFRGKASLLAELVAELRPLDYNLLLYASSQRSDESIRMASRIDVWWSPEAGNLALNIALVRFITAAEEYSHAAIRFILLSNDAADNDVLRTRTRRVLGEARVNATVEIFNNALERRPLAEWIAEQSNDAALTVFGLARNLKQATADYFENLEELSASLHAVLLAGSSSTFQELLKLARTKVKPAKTDTVSGQAPRLLDTLTDLPNPISANVGALAESYEAIVRSFHEHCVSQFYQSRMELLANLEKLIQRHFQQLRRACQAENLRKRRKAVHRSQASLASDAERAVLEFITTALPTQEATLDGRIEAFIRDERFLPTPPETLVAFATTREALLPKKSDSGAVRRYKRRRRLSAFFWRKTPTYVVPLRKLEVFYRDRVLREVLEPLVRSVTSDSHQLAAHVGKVMDTTELGLAALSSTLDAESLVRQVDAAKEQSLSHLEQLRQHQAECAQKNESESLAHAAACLADYAADVADVGISRRVNKERRPYREQSQLVAALDTAAARWSQSQALLLRRSQAEVQLAAFQQRVAVLVYREKERLAQLGATGPLASLRAFEAELVKLKALVEAPTGSLSELRGAANALRFERRTVTDATVTIERLEHECASAYQSLPEELELPTAETLEALSERGGETIETVSLALRALCQFLVESQLLGGLKERLESWPVHERRALMVAQDVERLITFQLSESELVDTTWEEGASFILPAIENGVQRLNAEVRALEQELNQSTSTFEANLASLVTATRISELLSASDTLDQKLRLERGRRAVTGVRGRLRSWLTRGKDLTTHALYRLSTGVLLARNLQHTAKRSNPSGTLRAFCEAHAPRPGVLEGLAFFYRQLFFGQATLNETFWVGRQKELDQARALVSGYERHGGAALVVHGERGAGKTAFCQRLSGSLAEREHTFQILPVVGGASTLPAFREAVEAAFGRRGTVGELFAALPAGSVVLLDDCELWWHRSPDGFAVIDSLLRVLEDKKAQCLLVLSMNSEAFHLLSRLRPITERALGVIECGPFDAETLRDIIRLRHSSTGSQFMYNGKAEDALSQWSLARLFAAHYHYSRGFVGPALQSWVTHIVDTGTPLQVTLPQQPDMSALDSLKTEHIALLVQLALHKQLHEDRLFQLGGVSARTQQEQLSSLERIGLVTQPRPQIFELNRFIQHLLVERFQQRGLLP